MNVKKLGLNKKPKKKRKGKLKDNYNRAELTQIKNKQLILRWFVQIKIPGGSTAFSIKIMVKRSNKFNKMDVG